MNVPLIVPLLPSSVNHIHYRHMTNTDYCSHIPRPWRPGDPFLPRGSHILCQLKWDQNGIKISTTSLSRDQVTKINTFFLEVWLSFCL